MTDALISILSRGALLIVALLIALVIAIICQAIIKRITNIIHDVKGAVLNESSPPAQIESNFYTRKRY